jgi:hypothetical protein
MEPDEDFRRIMCIGVRKIQANDEPLRSKTIRTMDQFRNPPIAGDYCIDSVDDMWEMLDSSGLLPPPQTSDAYCLLSINIDAVEDLPVDPRLALLGFDLSDNDHTNRSLLQERGYWCNALQDVFFRVKENGLLNLDDARLAQDLFQKAWPDIPGYTVWALYEVALG